MGNLCESLLAESFGHNHVKKIEPPILKALDDLYKKTCRKVMPLYPVNKRQAKSNYLAFSLLDIVFASCIMQNITIRHINFT
jgi:hypothetical protein